MDQRHIWVVSKGFAPDEGGLETYAARVASSYTAMGHHVTVFTQTSAGPRTITVDGFDVVDVGPGSQLSVFTRLLRAFVTRVRSRKPDMIHATTWRTALPALLVKSPLAVTVHGREINYAPGPLQPLMALVFKRSKSVVCVSNSTREVLRARSPQAALNATVAWNGPSSWVSQANSERFLSQPLRALSLCRLVDRKNIAAAVKSVVAARNAGCDIVYNIAGKGPCLDEIKSLITSLHACEYISVLGYVTDDQAQELYNSSDIFLHPQLFDDGGRDIEGFGIAVADAMLAGVVPIVGRDGGPAELVPNECGFVVDGNSTDEITSALMDLYRSPLRAREMSVAASTFAKRSFSWRSHAEHVVASTLGD